jgi:acylphosphatase
MVDLIEFGNFLSLKVVAHGLVQGVSFRAFVLEKARQLELKGIVRNLPSGEDVEIKAEGKKENLEKLLVYLKQGPRLAKIDNLTVAWTKPGNEYTDFKIVS